MELKVLITSPPDRENLVAEVWVDDCQFAEVSQEDGTRLVEMYAHPRGETWRISFHDLIEVMELASVRLDEMNKGKEPTGST